MGMTLHESHEADLETGALAAILRLHKTLRGGLHLPGEAGYEAHRHALDPQLDPRPAIVAEAAGPKDVQAAVVAAREHELRFSVQATGHGTKVPNDGGLLLKTGQMAGVFVDPDRRIARVAAGARWGQVLRASAPFGLAPASGSSADVGVVGYTLGGGIGWLSRKHGFAADCVIGADVVTAEGELLSVSRDRHPELFWALRGGGPGFGVVTAMDFALHPVPEIQVGIVHFARERAADILLAYRQLAATAPDELSTAVVVTPESVVVKAMYAGPQDEARQLLAPLGVVTTSMRFADAAMGGTAPRQVELFDALSDAAIAAVVAAQTTVEVRHWGGAMAAAGPDAGPVSHRATQFSVIAEARVPGLAKQASGGQFLNFLADTTRTEAAFTRANHWRLREVKRAYDPDNVFRAGHAVTPAAPRGARLA
jgi:FAD/FMN-containing dehydrogenase